MEKYTAEYTVKAAPTERGYLYYICNEFGQITAYQVKADKVIVFETKEVNRLQEHVQRAYVNKPLPPTLQSLNTESETDWVTYGLVILLIWLLVRLGKQ